MSSSSSDTILITILPGESFSSELSKTKACEVDLLDYWASPLRIDLWTLLLVDSFSVKDFKDWDGIWPGAYSLRLFGGFIVLLTETLCEVWLLGVKTVTDFFPVLGGLSNVLDEASLSRISCSGY